ncbi:response regulator transcription factor [Methylonatrum kenyense]|uniref:response regulator transcription factor n=1 Tax=Methylonatrum kenyense TaxID=455253 RepID=UPI0020BEF0E1|nr:response regulator transcription factor [Methylonatrum kenyense]MCK8517146.1 response regulator transcription factor [Methylonatrum kenyense]
MPRLLLVDDDRELNAMLAEYLGGDGFEVDSAYDGDDGLRMATAGGYDALVLDVMLPGRDGFAVLRELRRDQSVPVLMLTARGDDVDTVVGLELGADDYLPKPCNPRVLVARIRALLRRGQAAAEAGPSTVLEVGDLCLDSGRREVRVGSASIDLTGTEFDVLHCLIAQAGQLVDKDRISREALGRPLQPFDRSIDMHISNLRRKLGPFADGSLRIKTVRGGGYQYITANSTADAPGG